MKSFPKNAFLVLLVILALIWFPVYLEYYSAEQAIIISISGLLGGYVSDKFVRPLFEKKQNG